VDVWGAILVLARRFYITVPLLALAVGGAYMYTRGIAPEYHSTASIVLIGPTAPTDKAAPPPVNPYVTLGTATVATTIQLDTASAQTLSQIAAAGNSTNFTVSGVSRTSIVTIEATAKTPHQATSTANQLVSIIKADLATRQKPYAPNPADQITVQVLSPAQVATADTTSRTKSEAIMIGVALVIAILLTLVIDAILNSRQRRRTPAHAADPLSGELTAEKQQRTTVVRS